MFKLIEPLLASVSSIILNICLVEGPVDVIFRSFRILQADSVTPGACKFVNLFNHILVA